jgi:hypothetical protein
VSYKAGIYDGVVREYLGLWFKFRGESSKPLVGMYSGLCASHVAGSYVVAYGEYSGPQFRLRAEP